MNMGELGQALAAGVVSGGLVRAAGRWPILAWIALVPIFVVSMRMSALHAALAGALAGVTAVVSIVADRTQRRLIPLALASSAASWGVAYGCAASILQGLPVAWSALVLPLAAVAALLPMRVAGAPRWLSNPLARTQERWLAVVHIAGLGGDLAVAAVLAAASAGFALLWPAPAPGSEQASKLIALADAVFVVVALVYGGLRFLRARRSADGASRVRMAAVAANVPPPPPESGPLTGQWALLSPHARDIAAALERYEPHILRAARDGAELILLPECAVCVNESSRATWLETLASWAKRERVAIVAPFVDESVPSNELAVIDASGRVVGGYEKQHPAPRLEPRPSVRTNPGPYSVLTRTGALPLSTVICVDNDYADLLATARHAGGVLGVPANDWPIFEDLHHQTAVWSAAISGVPVLRSTGHGISSVYDGAGRVLVAQSSLGGPVVLVADVPIALA